MLPESPLELSTGTYMSDMVSWGGRLGALRFLLVFPRVTTVQDCSSVWSAGAGETEGLAFFVFEGVGWSSGCAAGVRFWGLGDGVRGRSCGLSGVIDWLGEDVIRCGICVRALGALLSFGGWFLRRSGGPADDSLMTVFVVALGSSMLLTAGDCRQFGSS